MTINSEQSLPMVIESTVLSRYSEVRCGVSTRIGGVSPEPLGLNLSYGVGDTPENVDENRNRFFSHFFIKQEAVAFTRQVHGDLVRSVEVPGMNETCDALMTNVPGIALTVSVADCVPILLFDPTKKAIAAIHAGWRGSKLQILSKTIVAMKMEFHCEPKDIIAFIGPAAGECCYEVGEEVASQFDSMYVQSQPGRKLHLNLKLYNKDILLRGGLLEKNIEVSSYCTICHPELFHSYRRDKERSGRMMGLIGMVS